jgi:hypothetical protein
VRSLLHALNLRVQLGHRRGEKCPLPELGPADFTVLHTTGVHRVAVRYCLCKPGFSHTAQLLRFKLFPASIREPHTCATFEVLRDCQRMIEEGNINATDYYRSLVVKTDARGLLDVPASFPFELP